MPLLSIVTIVKDHRHGLLKTIDSVLSQTCSDYEFIVVDGCSEDGTLKVIEENKSIFTKILYGPDKGIYDAMNKGLAAATGEFIIFMNAGDVFLDGSSLSLAMEQRKNADVIYCDYLVDYGYAKRTVKAKNVNELWKGMITSHQSTIIRTELMKKFPFDLSFRLSADFNSIYAIYRDGAVFRHINTKLSVMEPGGMSDVRRTDVYRDHVRTLKQFGINPFERIYYLYKSADATLRLVLKKILPAETVRKIISGRGDR